MHACDRRDSRIYYNNIICTACATRSGDNDNDKQTRVRIKIYYLLLYVYFTYITKRPNVYCNKRDYYTHKHTHTHTHIHTYHTNIVYIRHLSGQPLVPLASGQHSAPMNRENNMPVKNWMQRIKIYNMKYTVIIVKKKNQPDLFCPFFSFHPSSLRFAYHIKYNNINNNKYKRLHVRATIDGTAAEAQF